MQPIISYYKQPVHLLLLYAANHSPLFEQLAHLVAWANCCWFSYATFTPVVQKYTSHSRKHALWKGKEPKEGALAIWKVHHRIDQDSNP